MARFPFELIRRFVGPDRSAVKMVLHGTAAGGLCF
jgi:hypothetical protein